MESVETFNTACPVIKNRHFTSGTLCVFDVEKGIFGCGKESRFALPKNASIFGDPINLDVRSLAPRSPRADIRGIFFKAHVLEKYKKIIV